MFEGLKFSFQSTGSLLCYIMRTDSGHYQSFAAHSLCSLELFLNGLFLASTAHQLATRLNPQEWSVATNAFLQQFNFSHVIVPRNFLNPWDTCLRKACFLREGYLCQWNDGRREPKSSCFPMREIYRSVFLGGFHFELVKMKHLHFKKVSLQFFQQIPYLLTLLQIVFSPF